MATFIKAGFWETLCKPCRGYKGWLNLDELIKSLAPPAPEPAYKVYTALLTQSGGSGTSSLNDEPLTIGVTYLINDLGGSGWDFTNVGAPNNNAGTYFVATGTTPNSWGDLGVSLEFTLGAPVVTVLENTIGNIWFTYDNVGFYKVNSNGLFTIGKTFSNIEPSAVDIENYRNAVIDHYGTNFSSSDINIFTGDFVSVISSNNYLNNTPIEIRVYN